MVPVAHAQQLRTAIGPERGRFLCLEKATHHQLINKGGDALLIEIVKFFHEKLEYHPRKS